MRLASSFALASLFAATALGQATTLPKVPDSTFGLLRADVDQADMPAMFKSLTTSVNANEATPADEKAEVVKTLTEAEQDATRWSADFRKAGGKTVYVIFDATVISGQQPSMIVPVEEGADERALSNLLTTGQADVAPAANAPVTAIRVENTLIAGPAASIGRFKTLAPKPRPELAAALDAAGASPVRFAFVPTQQLRGFAEAGMPALPPTLGGGPTTDLTRNLSWMTVGLSTPPESKMSLTLQSPTAEGATTLSQILTKALESAAADPMADKRLPGMVDALTKLKPQVDGTTVRSNLDGDTLEKLLPQFVISVHRARAAATKVNAGRPAPVAQ